ncbi:uncharacterized protein ASCRUDRAFT_8035 [Ascoidea rubescens DSM 1968]|uniref:Uncharacterized protein n=1 Tax=Ascoidea rubescens DSM 1968 TaxID=1344418 RepID=A0A1D2VHH5_9ASCO|nr:hypothetical protein ASCRUDRAFT_8035 [Ascoidea rubescens DSM 1968]ODV61075.1 hypothetical protein ASCRUDRAFT_8035 [Ascoidea rubescens DSM 1968]
MADNINGEQNQAQPQQNHNEEMFSILKTGFQAIKTEVLPKMGIMTNGGTDTNEAAYDETYAVGEGTVAGGLAVEDDEACCGDTINIVDLNPMDFKLINVVSQQKKLYSVASLSH